MILSQTAIYALKATVSLAESSGSGPVRVDDLSSRLGVPRNYLSKILHSLARNRVLSSTRGPGGGFELGVAPEDLTLASVVGHFDDLANGSGCLLGRERCSDEDPCAAHERWKAASSAVAEFLNDTTIADLSRGRPATNAGNGPPKSTGSDTG